MCAYTFQLPDKDDIDFDDEDKAALLYYFESNGVQLITHKNEDKKDFYITTGVKLRKGKELYDNNSCYLKASQKLYKISEDFESPGDSDEQGDDIIEEDEENQLFPRHKKVIEFQLPRDFKTMSDSEGGFLSMQMPLQITPIGRESDDSLQESF